MAILKPAACAGCSYASTGSGFVPPDRVAGHTRLVVVGEAPGVDEEREGRGFVGKSGRLLRGCLKRAGLSPDPGGDVMFTNAVLCRPPGNKFPGPAVAEECLRRHQPTLPKLPMLLCGANATEALTGFALPSLNARGSILPLKAGGWATTTVHPAFIVRGGGEEGGKAQDHYYPLLVGDIKRALTTTEPHIPKINIATPGATLAAFEKARPGFFEVDIESQGGNPSILGVSWSTGESWVLDWSEQCKPLLEKMFATSTPGAHNAAYDVPELEEAGVKPPVKVIDSLNLAALFDPALPKGLEKQVTTHVPGALTWKGLVDHERGYDAETPKVRAYRELWKTVLERLGRRVPASGREWYRFYNGLDTGWGYGLTVHLRKRLEDQGRIGYYRDIMQPLQKPLLELGRRGLPVDGDKIRAHREACIAKEKEAAQTLERFAALAFDDGKEDLFGKVGVKRGFNADSNPQRIALLYGWFGIKGEKGAHTKGLSTGEEALERVISQLERGTIKPLKGRGSAQDAIDCARAMLAAKQNASWRRTYLKDRPLGRLQTVYSQHRNVAGRLSSGVDDTEEGKIGRGQANLQNIPKELRDIVVAPEGYAFVGGDWTAIQWALIMWDAAQLSGPRGFHMSLLEKHQRGEFDPHRYLAAHAFGVPEVQVTKDMRQIAKAFTFGRAFLGAPRTLGRKQGIKDDISEIVCSAHEKAFRLGEWQTTLIKRAKDDRYIQTPLGWRVYYWELDPKGPEVLARRIQGLEADLMKTVFLSVEKGLGTYSRILTTTHDSLALMVPEADASELALWLKFQMQQPIPWLGGRGWRAEVKIGKTWKGVS